MISLHCRSTIQVKESSQTTPAAPFELSNYSVFNDASVSSMEVNSEFPNDKTKFCVADVRKRLNKSLHCPKKRFNRDPDDPSG